MFTGNVVFVAMVSSVNLTLLIGSSPNRVKLLITINSGVGYVTCNAGDAPLTGLIVTPDQSLELLVERDGDMVKRSWFGTTSGGTGSFGIMAVERVG